MMLMRDLFFLALFVASTWSHPLPADAAGDAEHSLSQAAGFYCGNLAAEGVTYITDVFGTPRTDGYPHSGIDIGTNFEQNIPVRTPMGGKVVFAGLLEDYGLSIIIENDGYQVLLAHASSLTKGSAQIVQAGEVVMLSGGDNGDRRDGSSSGAHIHFEIRQCSEMGCQAVDPMTAFLPGQTQTCNWYQQVSDPSQNIRRARLDSNNNPIIVEVCKCSQ